ncbi:hypothetical protein CSUI_006220 [Cystoisospora suis]|uniref:Transmembrane protein n=1 Tax=Cystoisospora suis TaxID=483139 RepID=A0A2C6KUV3_9APIC|nr:hypothetical protein CSUI_006220 [Cystoisospora suis]
MKRERKKERHERIAYVPMNWSEEKERRSCTLFFFFLFFFIFLSMQWFC